MSVSYSAISKELHDTDIEYFGMRYTGCDQYINNFNPCKSCGSN